MISKLLWINKNVQFVIVFLLFSIINQQLCLSQAGTSIGIKAGAGFSRYFFLVPTNKDDISQSFVPVFQAGLVFSQMDKTNKGVQIELNYIQKAWEQKFKDQDIKYKVFMENIELPFLFHWRLGKKKSAIILNMGLHISYAYNAKIDSSGVSIKPPDINYKELGITPFDYGLDGGLGYEFGKDNSILIVQLMFSQGLRNYIAREKQDPLVVYRSLNQSLFLSCIYKIPLRKKKTNIPK